MPGRRNPGRHLQHARTAPAGGQRCLRWRTHKRRRRVALLHPNRGTGNLPPLAADRTIFNYVATYNDFERRFAAFLDKKASDVLRFAALGTTEQGESGTQFRVDYLKPSGAIGFYHPDWVVVQKSGKSEVNWIIETKGRVWEGTTAKDEAIRDWCERVTEAIGKVWRYMRVDQKDFDSFKPSALSDLSKSTSQLSAIAPSN